jgi:hypothetical protein
MFVAVKSLSKLLEKYNSNPVSTDGGMPYPQTYSFLDLDPKTIRFRIHWRKALLEKLSNA